MDSRTTTKIRAFLHGAAGDPPTTDSAPLRPPRVTWRTRLLSMKHRGARFFAAVALTGCGSGFVSGAGDAAAGDETAVDAPLDAPREVLGDETAPDVAGDESDAGAPARCCVRDGRALSCLDDAGVSSFDCTGEHDAGWMHCTLAGLGSTCELATMCWGAFGEAGAGEPGTVQPCP